MSECLQHHSADYETLEAAKRAAKRLSRAAKCKTAAGECRDCGCYVVDKEPEYGLMSLDRLDDWWVYGGSR